MFGLCIPVSSLQYQLGAQTLSYTHPFTPFTHGPDTDTHP